MRALQKWYEWKQGKCGVKSTRKVWSQDELQRQSQVHQTSYSLAATDTLRIRLQIIELAELQAGMTSPSCKP